MLAEHPEAVVGELDRCQPGLTVSIAGSYDELREATRINPHVAYTERFELKRFPREVLFDSSSLRFVHTSGAGINHLVPWDPERVDVCNAAGVQDEAMAQFAIARLIAMTCNFFAYHDQQRNREWRMLDAQRSTGGTLTVVGLGRIGQACARIARALGMTVHGVRARPEPCPGVTTVVGPDAMNEILSQSDYVIVVTPLTEQSRGLIGQDAIAAMKPGVLIHNMSRGGVIDESALIDALATGHVGAASLDVFETEPLPDGNPLWGMENVHITPHNGLMMTWDDYIKGATGVFLDNLERYRRGTPLRNVTDPHRGY